MRHTWQRHPHSSRSAFAEFSCAEWLGTVKHAFWQRAGLAGEHRHFSAAVAAAGAPPPATAARRSRTGGGAWRRTSLGLRMQRLMEPWPPPMRGGSSRRQPRRQPPPAHRPLAEVCWRHRCGGRGQVLGLLLSADMQMRRSPGGIHSSCAPTCPNLPHPNFALPATCAAHPELQVQVIDGRIVVNTASLTVQAQEAQAYTRVVTGGRWAARPSCALLPCPYPPPNRCPSHPARRPVPALPGSRRMPVG